jgi:GTP pyrophosphokinase
MQEEDMIQQEFQNLLNDYLNSSHRKKVDIIEKAFNFANQAHKGVKRMAGEPYILHPLAVARIVVNEIGLGSTSICAALLHDVVEDTDYTVEDIEAMFGKKIASIVDGLTKISGGVLADKTSEQAENMRRLLLTMSDDIRVVLIKIADRLHNMRTLAAMPKHKQLKISGETQFIYAPLAMRLGLFDIKTELENLCFRYDFPEIYTEIEKKLHESKEEREILYKEFSNPIREKLATDLPFRFDIAARIKSVYSIWHKMQTKDIPFEEVYDILALRVVFENEGMTELEERGACWRIYAEVTTLYKPHPDRTRDWISTPKSNGYEALHVTVMGPGGHWIEVQIRSRRMNEIAEKGLAAHWKYKSGEGQEVEEATEFDKWLNVVKEQLEKPGPDAVDFLDTFKLNLFASDIFVFTPKGDMKTLPQHATALDFAFNLHTDLGIHCIGAKVNHKLVPLNYELNSGDQVEILTSKKQRPQPEWINFVNTSGARGKIKSIFRKENRAFIRDGEKQLEKTLQEIDLKLDADNLDIILTSLKIKSKDDLFYRIGKSKINLNGLKELFKIKQKNKWVNYLTLQFLVPNKKTGEKEMKKVDAKTKTIQLTDDEAGTLYKIAECCHPIPGDEVLGFRKKDGTIVVHKIDCPKAKELKAKDGNSIITTEWVTHKLLSFPAGVEIKCIDNVGVLIKVLKVFSHDHSINIYRVQTESDNGIFYGKIYFYIHDVEEINTLIMNILKVPEVKEVKRLEE